MKLIKPNVEYIPQEEGYDGMVKHIERCGRVCYKSEDKITGEYTSAHDFVARMIKSGHTAMLEHGTLYLAMPVETMIPFELNEWGKYYKNHFSDSGTVCEVKGEKFIAVTTNYRVLVENDWLDDLQHAFNPTKYHKKRYTLKFICDRGVSHELVRHRVFSFAQESQRYCNYSKDKFNNELTYIIPSWYEGSEEEANALVGAIAAGLTLKKEAEPWAYWLTSLVTAQGVYFDLLNKGWTPQQARSVLPNATKTEIVMTGFEDDWKHFFDLRLRGTTGKPHPDMLVVAQLAWNEFKNKLNLEL